MIIVSLNFEDLVCVISFFSEYVIDVYASDFVNGKICMAYARL